MTGARKRCCQRGRESVIGRGYGRTPIAHPADLPIRYRTAMAGIGGFGGRRLAERMGRVGVWSFALQRLAATEEQQVARELEGLGFPAIWIPESLGSKEVLSHSALLLQATERVVIAPGIAN